MKKFLHLILEQINVFLGNAGVEARLTRSKETDSSILNTIELALYKQAAVHAIYSSRSFTGEIVKFDRKRQQLILKNFQKKVTAIIRIKDIQKISLVPDTVRQSQALQKM